MLATNGFMFVVLVGIFCILSSLSCLHAQQSISDKIFLDRTDIGDTEIRGTADYTNGTILMLQLASKGKKSPKYRTEVDGRRFEFRNVTPIQEDTSFQMEIVSMPPENLSKMRFSVKMRLFFVTDLAFQIRFQASYDGSEGSPAGTIKKALLLVNGNKLQEHRSSDETMGLFAFELPPERYMISVELYDGEGTMRARSSQKVVATPEFVRDIHPNSNQKKEKKEPKKLFEVNAIRKQKMEELKNQGSIQENQQNAITEAQNDQN